MYIDINSIPICVINLPERTERLINTKHQLNKFYSQIKDFNLIEGVKEKRSMIGIAKSHLKCIELAKFNNWEYVLIIEDDINFQSTKSYQYALEAFKQVPEDFEILTGGIYTSYKLEHYNEYWNSVEEFSGLHFYVVNKNAYDKILNNFKFDSHIDRWLGNAKGGKLKCYVVKEFFCIQFSGYSDNVKGVMDYSHLLKKFNVLK